MVAYEEEVTSPTDVLNSRWSSVPNVRLDEMLNGAQDLSRPTAEVFAQMEAQVAGVMQAELLGLDLDCTAARYGSVFSREGAMYGGGYTSPVMLELGSSTEAASGEVDFESYGYQIGSGMTATAYTMVRLSQSFVCDFTKAVRSRGVWALFDPEDDVAQGVSPLVPTLARQQLSANSVEEHFSPTSAVLLPYAERTISFEHEDAWSLYHWELFYHLPMLVSKRLREDGRYRDALRWLQSIFDPTNQNTDWPDHQRFWRVKPFMSTAEDLVDQWASMVGADADTSAIDAFVAQVAAWTEDPFDPHEVARLRPAAYQRAAFMAYLDTLIAWADDLYERDSRESTAEATQLYVLAKHLLGDRPVRLPTTENSEPPMSWNTLNASGESPVEAVENSIGSWLMTASGGSTSAASVGLPAAARFCMPYNPHMLEYWDTVDDRLYKLRNCLDIEGRYRQLPLLQPPLDPALLVQAGALGVSIESLLSSSSVTVPHYRFTVMLERAKGFNSSVRQLGSALLQALEKRDGEEVALLRAEHEVLLLEAGREVRERRIDEAKKALQSAEMSRGSVQARLSYYSRLVDGKLSDLEKEALRLTRAAGDLSLSAGAIRTLVSVVALAPQVTTGTAGFNTEWGAFNLATSANGVADGLSTAAAEQSTRART